ncbi:MAG: asparaginase [Chloroflexi bacterium]|nr:asparaginase [Chloroflexota bacterium]
MSAHSYLPIFETTRGSIIESVHFGAIAVVDSSGQLIASYGDPQTTTYMRSSAKPFQALPFIEAGGDEHFKLTPAEIAVICASHSGTDEHVRVTAALQSKVGVEESQLMCGIHPPFDQLTREAMKARSEAPSPNRHDCSGKHTGMLAFARLQGWPAQDYIDPNHPVQQTILATFSEMVSPSQNEVALGTDGCLAPIFAIPLYNAALAYARLADPSDLTPKRAAACETITSSMAAHPDMVAGPGRFDTELMEAALGRIISKSGAEGYQGIAIMADALSPDSPVLGIALKISDGDRAGRARTVVAVEVLRQLGALSNSQLDSLSDLGPTLAIRNWRDIDVGEGRPTFTLKRS